MGVIKVEALHSLVSKFEERLENKMFALSNDKVIDIHESVATSKDELHSRLDRLTISLSDKIGEEVNPTTKWSHHHHHLHQLYLRKYLTKPPTFKFVRKWKSTISKAYLPDKLRDAIPN